MTLSIRRNRIRKQTWGLILTCVVGGTPLFVSGQVSGGSDEAALAAFVRVTAAHFGLPESEVAILAEERLPVDELPVVLKIAEASGIAPAALIALRRSGQGWMALGARYGVGAATFHESIPEAAVDDRTRRVFTLFRDTPSSAWNSLQLTDDEVITLVNLSMLTRGLGADHGRVLRARAEAGSFVLALRLLAG